jgi:hypothetical protein
LSLFLTSHRAANNIKIANYIKAVKERVAIVPAIMRTTNIPKTFFLFCFCPFLKSKYQAKGSDVAVSTPVLFRSFKIRIDKWICLALNIHLEAASTEIRFIRTSAPDSA